MTESFDLTSPGRFTVGAIGEPGHRAFYFQAFAQGTEVAVKCEKQQAQALAEHLLGLLEDLPEQAPDNVEPAEALPPGELRWAVGSISIGVDRDESRIIVMLEEMIDPDEAEADGTDPAQLRVRLTPEQVRGFDAQVQVLMSTSRPLCRLCEHPIDPSGHACPRLN